MNLKNTCGNVFIKPFFKCLKKHTYKPENTWEKLFADTVFEIIKKSYLRIYKIPGTTFLVIFFFKIFKKAYLRIQKCLGLFFWAETFSSI